MRVLLLKSVFIFTFIFAFILFDTGLVQGSNRASNSDLREVTTTFVIEKVSKEKLSYSLIKDGQQGHRLEQKVLLPKLKITTRRISNNDAQSFDSQFVALFIDTKYSDSSESSESSKSSKSSEAKVKKSCSSFFKLTMRGDEHTVCSDEKRKIKIVNNFLDKIKLELIR